MGKEVKIYLTACGRRKKRDAQKINAIERYISKRIKNIYEKSKKDSIPFRILSGKFGLLEPDKKIEWYDKLLLKKDFPELSKLILNQIKNQNIKEIIFFAINPKEDKLSKPYLDIMKKICLENNIKLKIIFVK